MQLGQAQQQPGVSGRALDRAAERRSRSVEIAFVFQRVGKLQQELAARPVGQAAAPIAEACTQHRFRGVVVAGRATRFEDIAHRLGVTGIAVPNLPVDGDGPRMHAQGRERVGKRREPIRRREPGKRIQPGLQLARRRRRRP